VNDTYVTVVGRVASELRCSTTDGGIPVASFRVATTPRRYSPSGWTDGHTSYVTVTCWRGLADNVKDSLKKGQPVVVHGRQSVRPWKRDERTGTSVEIDADAVGHDLRWGTARFEKTTKSSSSDARESHADESASSWDSPTGESIGERQVTSQPGTERAGFEEAPSQRPSLDGWSVPGAGGTSAAA